MENQLNSRIAAVATPCATSETLVVRGGAITRVWGGMADGVKRAFGTAHATGDPAWSPTL